MWRQLGAVSAQKPAPALTLPGHLLESHKKAQKAQKFDTGRSNFSAIICASRLKLSSNLPN